MPSINLLPKSFNFNLDNKEEQKLGNKFINLVSFLVIVISVVSFAGLYLRNMNQLKEIEDLHSEITEVEKKIEQEIADNKLLLVENRAEDADLLLSNHLYFNKALDVFRSNLVDEVYLNSLIINFDEKGLLTSEFDGAAKTFSSLISQIYIFKNGDIFKDFKIEEGSTNDDGFVDFGGTLELKKEVILY